jgi:hypothetical protein
VSNKQQSVLVMDNLAGHLTAHSGCGSLTTASTWPTLATLLAARGTRAVSALIAAIAAPVYFRVLVANQPLTTAAADAASAAALAFARAGAFTRKRRKRS